MKYDIKWYTENHDFAWLAPLIVMNEFILFLQ